MSKLPETTIGDYITLQRGFDITKKEQTEGCYPVVSSGGISSYHNEYRATGPGVIIGRKGTLGSAFYVDSDYWPHDTTLWVKDFKGNEPKFIFYFLNKLGLKRLDSGSSNPTLNRNFVHQIKAELPDIDSQIKISTVLSEIDKKIELNNCISAELEAMAKTLYDYWFVQFDFPDDSPQGQGKPYKTSGGKMVYNPTLKREIPEGWSDIELEEIIERSGTGLNPRDNFKLGSGNNYYVTIKNVTNGKIVLDDKCDKIDDEALKIIDRRSQLQPGDVLFTSIQPVGVTFLIQEKPSNWNINESVFTLRPNLEMANPEYLYMLLSSMEMKAFTKNSSSGSVHKGIRHGVLKSFRLAHGGKKIVDNFSQLITPMLKRMHTLDKENSELVKLRDWLLPMLMNGQVTVK